MPYALPPITLAQNQTSSVNIPGNLGSVVYVKFVNASPYLLQINNLLGGTDYMQPGEANVWPVPGLTTAIQVTPQQFGINPIIIPSTVLVVTWYLEGEQPSGNYPVNFNTISYLGSTATVNSATNTIEQDMWTPFVLTGLVPSADGTVANQLDVTSGIAFPRQTDGSLLRQAPASATFLTTVPSTTYFLDLNFDGSWSWGVAHSGQTSYLSIAQVTTDGSGNISAVTDERQLNSTLFNQMAGDVIFNLVTFVTATRGGGNVMLVNGGASVGSLTAGAPVKLAAGNQETGMCGGTGQTAAVNLFIDMPINFKTVLTNTPTSISFTGLQTGNANAPSADTFHTYGCRMFWKAPSAGQTEWIGSYTTVGNCLLAVNAAARTFDFHCDPCGAVHPALPLSAARVMRGHDLSVVCPACGASEAFDTALSAADETDMTPQGSGAYATTRGAQARLVRQLMTALGLEVTP